MKAQKLVVVIWTLAFIKEYSDSKLTCNCLSIWTLIGYMLFPRNLMIIMLYINTFGRVNEIKY